MTSERRKSVLILVATLILGIAVGVLGQGFFNKMQRRGGGNAPHSESRADDRKSNWFAEKITRIIRPDSAQAQKVKLITQTAATQIDSIESNANLQMSLVLDSVKNNLRPILSEDQWKRLKDFDAKAKSNWHGRSRRPRGQ